VNLREGGVSPSRFILLPDPYTMPLCRACLVALLLALSAILSCVTAHAAALDEALAHFTADDFSETITGIKDVAASGSPRAEAILRALQDGQLLYSAERKAVYIKSNSGKLLDAASGEPIGGDAPADADNVRINNRLRGAIEAALGGLTLLASDPSARFDAAQAVFKSRQVSALPTIETALAKEQDARVKRALTEALLEKMDQAIRTQGGKFTVILFDMDATQRAEYRRFVQSRGINFVDCDRPEMKDRKLRMPDNHPNQGLNQLVAQWIEPLQVVSKGTNERAGKL